MTAWDSDDSRPSWGVPEATAAYTRVLDARTTAYLACEPQGEPLLRLTEAQREKGVGALLVHEWQDAYAAALARVARLEERLRVLERQLCEAHAHHQEHHAYLGEDT